MKNRQEYLLLYWLLELDSVESEKTWNEIWKITEEEVENINYQYFQAQTSFEENSTDGNVEIFQNEKERLKKEISNRISKQTKH